MTRRSDIDAARGQDPPRAPETLRATQRLLRALVTAPNGVEPALEGRPGVDGWLDDWADPRRELEGHIVGDDRLRTVDRLDVYAQAYFARLHEVLLEDHPTVAWICGEAAFHDLVTAFLVAHPSRSPNLRDLGRPFADFLARHPVAGFARERWPSLADVARLEWAFCDVFDAPDVPALERDDLLALDPQAWASIALAPVAAFRRLDFDRGVGQFVRARRRGEAVPDEAGGAETLVVWRENERAVFRNVAGLEARALARVEDGTSFGALCLWAGAEVGEAEAAAQAAAWLAEWVGAGWLGRHPEAPELR